MATTGVGMRIGIRGVWMWATLALAVGPTLHAQTVVWSDNFNNGCAGNCEASTWNGWSMVDNVDGTTGGAPNNWFVSCSEEGITPPGCGSSCIGDASLHIGSNPGAGGDMSASYNDTGATNATYRLAVSPTINLSGRAQMFLEFDFIAFGSSACSDDRAQLRLSTDNGATWPVGYQYCLTSVCCGACNGYSQGQWTKYSLALPAAFENNPNVRIGFHWRNNGNGSATDPSVAIDDIRIVVPDVDFGITKTNNVDAVLPGGTVTYTIVARRPWVPFSIDANGVSITDHFPAALTGCTTTCTTTGGATCAAGPIAGDIDDTVNLPNDYFAGGSSITYTSVCTVSPTATGTLVNTASITSGPGNADSDPGNNTATDTDMLTTEGVFLDGFETLPGE